MIENEMTVSVPLEVVKASEIEPKEVKWLWYPYIPFGKVTLLQGDPGDGKSKLTYENMNVIEERIPFNVHFKTPTAPTYMEQLKQMETDGLVSLRGLRKDATIFNEIVIDVNTMYFERNGGYEYAKVKIFRYVTENTFDAYMWQILENKQKFISQIMTSKSPVRACEDVDDTALSYAEIKALATGNPYIKEKMDLDVQVSKLKLLKANHTSQIYRLESDIAKNFPVQISALKERIAGMQIDSQVVKSVDLQDNDTFAMTVGNVLYEDKKEAGEALIAACAGLKTVSTGGKVGEYHGFTLSASYNMFSNAFELTIKGKCSYKLEIGKDPVGNMQRIHNTLSSIDRKLTESEQKLETVQQQLATAQEEVKKPFPKETELNEKMERLSELNALLNMDEKGNETIMADEDIGREGSSTDSRDAVEEKELPETADRIHKPSILERLKQEKAQQNTAEPTVTQKAAKKKHEQEL